MQEREDGYAYAADVTIKELGEFVHSHSGEHGCRCCGTDSWVIPEHEGKPIILTLPSPLAHSDGVNAFCVACSNCGHMETFLAQVVVSKLIGWT